MPGNLFRRAPNRRARDLRRDEASRRASSSPRALESDGSPLALYSSSMHRVVLRPVSIVILGAVLAGGLAVAAPRERRFFSARHGVGVETPIGWSLSRHTGY